MVSVFVRFDNTTIAPNYRYSLPTLPQEYRPPYEAVVNAFMTNGYGVAAAYKPDGTGYLLTGERGGTGVNVYAIINYIVAN